MWTLPRRLLSHHRLINRNLLRQNDAIVGWFNSKLSFARGKQDDVNDDSFRVSRLFEPAIAKSGTDTSVGAELTGKIKRSNILMVLNQFSQRAENRSICLEHGLDGERMSFEFTSIYFFPN